MLLFRFYHVSLFYTNINGLWEYPIVLVGVLSIVIGCLAGIEQRKIKSLLAYSSISHMGYLMLSFSCVNNTFMAFQSYLLYILIYVLSGLSIWFLFTSTVLKRHFSSKKVNKDLGDFVY